MRSWVADTVLRMRSRDPAAATMLSLLVDTTKLSGGLLGGRGGDGGHGVAHGPGQLYAHLTQASDTHHPHPHATLVIVMFN